MYYYFSLYRIFTTLFIVIKVYFIAIFKYLTSITKYFVISNLNIIMIFLEVKAPLG